jgi:hypothetical protein
MVAAQGARLSQPVSNMLPNNTLRKVPHAKSSEWRSRNKIQNIGNGVSKREEENITF